MKNIITETLGETTQRLDSMRAASTFRPWDIKNEEPSEEVSLYFQPPAKVDESMSSLISVGLGLDIKLPKHLMANRLKSAGAIGARRRTEQVNPQFQEEPVQAAKHQIQFYYSRGLRKL